MLTFSIFILKKKNYKKPEYITSSVFKNACCDVFVFLIIFFFFIKLEKVNKCLTFQGFFKEKNDFFRKSLVSL